MIITQIIRQTLLKSSLLSSLCKIHFPEKCTSQPTQDVFSALKTWFGRTKSSAQSWLTLQMDTVLGLQDLPGWLFSS